MNPVTNPPFSSTLPYMLNATDLRKLALHWLIEPAPAIKAEGVKRLRESWLADALQLDVQANLTTALEIPGRPALPELVPPLGVKRRAMNTVEGRAVLIHALTHIEFNAIKIV